MKKKTSYTRVVSHLLKTHKGIAPCLGVKKKDIDEMYKLLDDEVRIQIASAPKTVPLPPVAVSTNLYKGYESKKRKESEGSTSVLAKAFNNQGRKQLDALIARFFYASGLPFHLERSPYYASSHTYAAINNLAGYVPPGYNALRTTLLDQEKANVERLLQPIKSTWHEKGISIVSDGWSDSQRRPLINFMAITESGPMFLKAVDCSGEIKDKFFIFNLMKEVIEEVGSENVIQVITDNARNCQATGQLVEGSYPSIVCTPCVVHTLNLALQNICSAKNIENNQETYGLCSWISDVSTDATMIKVFIMNHGMRLTMFNKFVSLKLLSIATTRFASVLVMLKCFKLIKRSLLEMVISEEWDAYREDNVEKAAFVKMKVLDDTWWDKVDYILSFAGPLYDMLRACDTDKPCFHLVYDMWDSMIENVKKAIYTHEGRQPTESSSFYDVVYAILISRWTKNNTPLHCLAHSLNPRYYSEEWLQEGVSDFSTPRVAPHTDHSISKNRITCLKKYFPNAADRRVVAQEFANFSTKAGDFCDSDSIESRYDMDPKSWWVTYGTSAPVLQGLALKLLVQPSFLLCAERNWSTYSFIHSVRRNKMTPKRAENLVFIHSNLRLLSRKTPEYFKGETKLWDIGGDKFSRFDDVGELKIAEFSLDEPELESVIFDDNEHEEDHEMEDEE